MDNQCFDDRMMMNDTLNTQKQITQMYNHYAGECSCPQCKDTLMDVLQDEHDMQYEVYQEMAKRGWYTVQCASENEVECACKKFKENEKVL